MFVRRHAGKRGILRTLAATTDFQSGGLSLTRCSSADPMRDTWRAAWTVPDSDFSSGPINAGNAEGLTGDVSGAARPASPSRPAASTVSDPLRAMNDDDLSRDALHDRMATPDRGRGGG